MLNVFEKMIVDPSKMARIKGHTFQEAAFFSLYKYVKNGGKLSDLSWFTTFNHSKK